jgi:hypothetical protein
MKQYRIVRQFSCITGHCPRVGSVVYGNILFGIDYANFLSNDGMTAQFRSEDPERWVKEWLQEVNTVHNYRRSKELRVRKPHESKA